MPFIAWFGKKVPGEENTGSDAEEKEGPVFWRASVDQKGQSSEQ
jgi:hypothetical protein